MPTALATLYCTSADVDAYLSATGADERLNDSGGPGATPTAGEEAYLTTQGINYATARVNMYLLGHYSAARLAESWVVNEWTTILASRRISKRRGNPCPASIQEEYEEAIADMKEIRAGNLELNDVELREPAWPYWSNIKVDTRFRVNQSRVVGRTSEDTPMDYAQKKDHQAAITPEPYY